MAKNEKFYYLKKKLSLNQLTKGHSFECKIKYLLLRVVVIDYSSSLVLIAVQGKLRHVSVALII